MPGGSGLISSHRAKGWRGVGGNDAVALAFLGRGLPWTVWSLSGIGGLPSQVKGRALGLGKPERRIYPLQKSRWNWDTFIHMGCDMLTPGTGSGLQNALEVAAPPTHLEGSSTVHGHQVWLWSRGIPGKSLPMASRISV